MPRRVNLPGASELFRPTSGELPGLEEAGEASVEKPQKPAVRPRRRATVPAFETAVAPVQPAPAQSAHAQHDDPQPDDRPDVPPQAAQTAAGTAGVTGQAAPAAVRTRRTRSEQVTGRVRHDEKITVYVSRDELLALESARLELRGEYDLAVDRGRIVREAIAIVMADLAAQGGGSDLVRRLNGQ